MTGSAKEVPAYYKAALVEAQEQLCLTVPILGVYQPTFELETLNADASEAIVEGYGCPFS
jgi:hypothetical protein